jgi:hypothetical protein
VGCSIGGDTGEFGPATAIDPGTAPCGVWSGLVVRLGGAVNTLLGPEETSPRVCGVVLGWCNATFGCHTGPRRRGVGVWWWLWGLWVGRCLRIAQWTRASLWSSCRGRTVDALAPGADEGRGRPR